MTDIGAFKGCGGYLNECAAIDLAIDGNMNAFVTLDNGFGRVDLTTAAVTVIAKGTYPNSLSFVPAGTLDPTHEALVGYRGNVYERIDTCTGAITPVGSLSNGYSSSGDIVSVKDGGTFLTVAGNNCGDCLFQIDPVTGDEIKNYGSLKHSSVWGIAFWAGAVYGFDTTGHVFTVTWDGTKIVSTDITVSPSNIAFYGAGSTTYAPITDADGGTLPLN